MLKPTMISLIVLLFLTSILYSWLIKVCSL